jgi:hypothetical protein
MLLPSMIVLVSPDPTSYTGLVMFTVWSESPEQPAHSQ